MERFIAACHDWCTEILWDQDMINVLIPANIFGGFSKMWVMVTENVHQIQILDHLGRTGMVSRNKRLVENPLR
jgi:predicted dinucleotide-utilizing enzyme